MSNTKTNYIIIKATTNDEYMNVEYAVLEITEELVNFIKRVKAFLQPRETIYVLYDTIFFYEDDLTNNDDKTLYEIAENLENAPKFVTSFPTHEGANVIEKFVTVVKANDEYLWFEGYDNNVVFYTDDIPLSIIVDAE